MAVIAAATDSICYDDLKEHLYRQYDNVRYAPDTGLPPEALRERVGFFLATAGHLPRVLRKAAVFEIILSQAQIAVDPTDWFVDKLNHDGILRSLQAEWRREVETSLIPDAAA